ncbi:SH3 domain-containing protein [Parachitinimonas caeni]|uniref:SH3 domain-containing protein n=1 Tax=Parachitinimonas caeni TaxID=3031301 RepID=A0ABT7DVW2_9NEIS|nr:SH3 domain-containing protein [Parachitinimonas caeni]MDK2124124.1 SH3 domain-containing protein [Parachitinimonas caeni]
MDKRLINACLAGLLLTAAPSFALEFRSTAEHGTILYESPSEQAKKVFLVSKSTPLEVLVEHRDWLRVRDQAGSLAWVQKKSVSSRRTVQVTAIKTELRKDYSPKSTLIARLERGVVVDLLDMGKNGWVKVQHRDGAVGYLRIEEVWGL